jgi:hypothetical protein
MDMSDGGFVEEVPDRSRQSARTALDLVLGESPKSRSYKYQQYSQDKEDNG